MCAGVSVHMHLRPFWCRIEGGVKRKGGRLPADGGRGHKDLGQESVSPHIRNTSIVPLILQPLVLPIRKL